MGRAKAYSSDELIEAVRQLILNDKTINGTNLRLQMGKGRPSSLLEDYNQLVEQGMIHDHTHPSKETEYPLPESVLDLKDKLINNIDKLVWSINNSAHRSSESRIEQIQSDLTESQLYLQEMKEHYETGLAKSFNANEDLQDENQDLKIQVNECNERLTATTEQLANLEVTHQSACADNTELKAKVEQLEHELNREQLTNAQLRVDNDKFTDSISELSLALRKKTEQCDAHQLDIAKLQKLLIQSEANYDKECDRAANLDDKITEMATITESYKIELKSTQNDVKDLATEKAFMDGEIAQLKLVNSDLNKSITAERALSSNQAKEISKLEHQLESLRAQLEVVNNDLNNSDQ